MRRGWEIPFYRRLSGNAGIEPGDIGGLEDISKLPVYDKSNPMESGNAVAPYGDFEVRGDDRVVFHTPAGTAALPPRAELLFESAVNLLAVGEWVLAGETLSSAKRSNGGRDESLTARITLAESAAKLAQGDTESAGRLLGEGKSPTMEEVAAEAMVSRATAYRYFPSLEALLVEAPIHGSMPDPSEIFPDGSIENPEDRIDAMESALHEMVYDNELQLRAMLLNSLRLSLENGGDGVPVRQSRRMGLIDAGAAARLDRYIGSYQPYYNSHDALDADKDVQEEVRNVARSVVRAVEGLRAGRLRRPDPRVKWPRPK